MMRRFLSLSNWTEDDVAAGAPFYAMLFLVLAGLYVGVLVSDEAMRQSGPFALFTGLMLVHGVLHALSARLFQRWRWLLVYCLVQGALAFALGYLTGAASVIIGLNMALVGESAGLLWPDRRAIAASATFFILLLVLNIAVLWGGDTLLGFLPIVGGSLVFVLVYAVLYIRQVTAREESQKLLQELEAAHRQLQEYAGQVEELTISQERQRMARELHDTLAQGLAGLILQLEAADSHLDHGNPERAQAVVQQAMQRARTTLQEARRAIQDLRPAALEQGNLVDALGHEANHFAATTGIQTTFQIDGDPPDLAPEVAQDALRIVQESLSNVARHAQASHVGIWLVGNDNRIQIVVQDDGLGFDPVEAQEYPGCFGLKGVQERAERIGGNLRIESERRRGTSVTLEIEGGGS